MGWKATATAAACWCALGLAPAMSGPALPADFGKQHGSGEVRRVARWVLSTVDHEGLPFAIVDKLNARMYVFDPAGRIRGVSTILLGQALGDDSAPNVGEHAQDGQVPLHERTTPAGRFFSQPGRNLRGEHVVWVDYESAFAIHRLRPGVLRRERESRLASTRPMDRRASLGCVVVPVQFYANVVTRFLGRGRALVYVLPESGAARGLSTAL